MKKILQLLLLLTILAVSPTTYASAAGNPAQIGFEPQVVNISTDAITEVAVNIKDVADLYAFDLTIHYDPAFLVVIDADPARADVQVNQGTFLAGGMVVKNIADPLSGNINYVTTQLNPSPSKSGSGNLLVIRFRGKKVGGTQLSMGEILLSTRDGLPIQFETNSANVTISATAAVGATPTPFDIIKPTSQFETPKATVVVSAATAVASAAKNTQPPAVSGPTATLSPNGKPTKASTYTPTAEILSGNGTPTPKPGTLKQFIDPANLLWVASTILELIVVIALLVFVYKKMQQRKNKSKRKKK